ncbi:bifunctional riboflavin kinase/FAD synthetase [Ilyomonas limi]|uniref:Riboflavin biosynthesis protein n=2 Tax=Ilyomonas limi TaxID=2575867 RepID=A0A4U3L200_9BACT|nr:bifunctional riboflavin kinase/FAD synthetase [Ilyomonas limi]
MLVHRDLAHLPHFRNAVVTIGTFDGVHAGHRKIIEQLKSEAEKVHGETVIITFHPHPRKVVREGQLAVPILTTLPEKITLLQSLGIDHLVVIPFDAAFSNQGAEEYIQHFLWEKFHPHTVIIGYDHKFGKGRCGDYHLLEKYGKQLGFEVKEIPEHVLNEVIISSTRIREALLKSDVAAANKFLSYTYFFEGLVVMGNQLGRTIGYPTANLEIADKEKLIPGNGVYAVEAEVVRNGHVSDVSSVVSDLGTNLPLTTPHSLKGMMNIGVRPTVDGTKRTIEVNLFDFDKDIYGQTLRVFIKHYIRGEVKFSGLDALKAQLAADKQQALKLLNSEE